MVGKVAHRIERLPGGPGGHQHLQPFHILGGGRIFQIFQQDLRLGQLARADISAGQTARRGFDHCKTKAAQLLKVPLRRRIQIHRGIHCRSGQLGTGAGQYCGGQHIVSQSVCQLGKDVRGGGGDHRQISPFGQSNMLHLKRVGAVEGIDRHTPLGNPLKGVGRNKMERVGGHDDVDRSARLDQRARKGRRFIGRNAARNTQQNIFSFQHPVFSFCAEVRLLMPDSRFSQYSRSARKKTSAVSESLPGIPRPARHPPGISGFQARLQSRRGYLQYINR